MGLLMWASRNLSHSSRHYTIVILSAHPLWAEGRSNLRPVRRSRPSSSVAIIKRSESFRPLPLQLMGRQVPIRQAETLPIHLHRVHRTTFKLPLRILITVLRTQERREAQLPKKQGTCIFWQFTNGRVGLFPHRLSELGLVFPGLFTSITSLRATVRVSVRCAAKLP